MGEWLRSDVTAEFSNRKREDFCYERRKLLKLTHTYSLSLTLSPLDDSVLARWRMWIIFNYRVPFLVTKWIYSLH